MVQSQGQTQFVIRREHPHCCCLVSEKKSGWSVIAKQTVCVDARHTCFPVVGQSSHDIAIGSENAQSLGHERSNSNSLGDSPVLFCFVVCMYVGVCQQSRVLSNLHKHKTGSSLTT